MKKIAILLLYTLLLNNSEAQQNVGIGTTTPNASAALDISSTNKGMLIPRLTTAQRNAIASPVKGLLVFDSEYNSYWHHTGAGWKEIAGNAYNADSTLIYGGGSPSSVNMTVNGQILTGSSGFLYDNGGPSGNYGNNQVTMASILPELNQLAVNVVVLSLALETPLDSLVIKDTYGNRYVLTGTMTGSYRLFGTVDFLFRSNATNTQAGFAIRWDRILSDNNNHYDSTQLSGWFFNPSQLYMRGGFNQDHSWAPDSSGRLSFAYGSGNKAMGAFSFAAGEGNKITESYATAIGVANIANGFGSVAMGYANDATSSYAVALGYNSVASGHNSFAVGSSSVAEGNMGVALGLSSRAVGGGSVAIGAINVSRGPFSTALGVGTKAKGYGNVAVGMYNDTTDAIIEFISPVNRVFQIGNGNDDGTRKNALTVLHNGNVGIGILNPEKNLVVASSIRLDGNDNNNGTNQHALYFGGSSTGEFIASKRNEGGNQWGLDFFTDNEARMTISNSGLVSMLNGQYVQGQATFQNSVAVNSNVTVQNGKGIVRSITAAQQKIQSIIVPVNLSLGANSTTTLSYNWTEAFSNAPVAFLGNIAAGSGGGWAEVVLSLATPSVTGGILYVFNPRSTTASMNFNLVIIGIGQ